MSVSIFVCDPWESYMHQLAVDSERELIEMDRQADLDREEEIDREIIEQIIDEGCEPEELVPFYAAAPFEVEEPEVIEAEIEFSVADSEVDPDAERAEDSDAE